MNWIPMFWIPQPKTYICFCEDYLIVLNIPLVSPCRLLPKSPIETSYTSKPLIQSVTSNRTPKYQQIPKHETFMSWSLFPSLPTHRLRLWPWSMTPKADHGLSLQETAPLRKLDGVTGGSNSLCTFFLGPIARKRKRTTLLCPSRIRVLRAF